MPSPIANPFVQPAGAPSSSVVRLMLPGISRNAVVSAASPRPAFFHAVSACATGVHDITATAGTRARRSLLRQFIALIPPPSGYTESVPFAFAASAPAFFGAAIGRSSTKCAWPPGNDKSSREPQPNQPVDLGQPAREEMIGAWDHLEPAPVA